MIISPQNEDDAFGLLMVEENTHYSNISFMMEYIKDGVFEFLFEKGKYEFKEILTNYSKPELRPYVMVDENGETPDNPKKFTTKGLTASITLGQNFDMNARNGMSMLPIGRTMYRPMELDAYVLKDSLIALSYSTVTFNYTAEINVTREDELEVHNMFNRLYSRMHLGKKFFLAKDIKLKHIIDPRLISVIKSIYKEDSNEELNARLNEMTGGNIYEELDRTTGNKVTVIDLHTNPILAISNMSTSNEGGSLSLEMEVALPTRFWLTSAYSAEKLNNLVVVEVGFTRLDELSVKDKERALNFDFKFLSENREYFVADDATLDGILDGTVLPKAILTGLTEDELDLIGTNIPRFQRIENIILSINEPVNGAFVDTIVKNNNEVDVSGLTFKKIKTVIDNRMNDDDIIVRQITIDDDLIRNVYRPGDENYKLNVSKNSKNQVLGDDYLIDFNANTGELKLRFLSPIDRCFIVVELYKKKV